MSPEAPKTDRDDVISGYTRHRIRQWEDEGRQLLDLAKAAGIAKASPSQVKRGATGVGKKTEQGYARAFGFASVDDFRAAAWVWWRAQGAQAAAAVEIPHTAAMSEAIEAVLALGQGSHAQVETILAAYGHDRFHDRDVSWWTQTLLAELARDAEGLRRDKLDRERENDAQRQIRAAQQALKPKARERPATKRKAG